MSWHSVTQAPLLHKYVLISFSSKPQTFLCVFTLHLYKNDRKQWSLLLKTINFENGLQSRKIWKQYCYNVLLSGRGIVFTENANFWKQCNNSHKLFKLYWHANDKFLLVFTVSIIFIFSVWTAENDMKTVRKRYVYAIQSLRFHWIDWASTDWIFWAWLTPSVCHAFISVFISIKSVDDCTEYGRQRRVDFYVIFTMTLCSANFSEAMIRKDTIELAALRNSGPVYTNTFSLKTISFSVET